MKRSSQSSVARRKKASSYWILSTGYWLLIHHSSFRIHHSDFRHVDDAEVRGGVFDGADERGDHLRVRDEAEAQRRLALRGQALHEFVEREEQVGPAVAGAEDVPGPEYRRTHP